MAGLLMEIEGIQLWAISRETGETYLFEAVILPFTYASKTERAEIKRLELAIQMGTEERQAYDPVDLAVDIYQTVVVDKLMTENDYAKEANIKQKKSKTVPQQLC